jgi:hypothetical protein
MDGWIDRYHKTYCLSTVRPQRAGTLHEILVAAKHAGGFHVSTIADQTPPLVEVEAPLLNTLSGLGNLHRVVSVMTMYGGVEV